MLTQSQGSSHSNQQTEQLEQLIGHFIEDAFSSVVELFTHLLNKAETLNYIVRENKIKK